MNYALSHANALERIEAFKKKGGGELDLSNLELEKIPPQLQGIKNLTSLSLYNNRLKKFPYEILDLPDLVSLELGRNLISELPSDLWRMEKIKSFSIWENQFNEFPVQILSLSSLNELILDGNSIRSFPDDISKLSKLVTLSANGCQIDELSKSIFSLESLVVLKINRNHLLSLPSSISRLRKLTTLEVVRNKLNSLPPELTEIKKLTKLYLHGNSDLRIPSSILGPTHYEPKQSARPQDILNFYFSRNNAEASGTSRSLNEIKLMLVGRGGAGKTSLRRFFMGEEHNRDEPETPGIALDNFKLQCGNGDVVVRLWDFAGQEITHALHKFFLTEGCVYILVLDPRSNTEMHDAEYWLALLKRYSGKSPVIIALNRQDARQGGYDVDRRMLLERFPSVLGFVQTNCEQRTTCAQLQSMLCEAIESLSETEPPHLKVPESWIKVISECDGNDSVESSRLATIIRWLKFAGHKVPEGKQRQHMTLDEFREICADHGEGSYEKQESLARLLHKLGAILHFVDEPRLRDTAVLNPHWVTDGVYRLLRYKDKPEGDGILSIDDALAALPGETDLTARFLLRLMERFDMCFPIDDFDVDEKSCRWLVPGALGEFQPVGVGSDWHKNGAVRLRFVYDPLPEGVLPRFIVMTNILSEGSPRWRNGVVLVDGNAKALVRRGEKRDHVDIVAVGPEDERLRLLEIIQGTLERIHADLPEPKPVAEIEIAGLAGTYRSVADLEAAEMVHQSIAVSTGSQSIVVEPTKLLNRASEPESRRDNREPLTIFLSYAYKDRRSKDIFKDNLTVMMKKKRISPWREGVVEDGVQWCQDIYSNYSTTDVFVGLLTTALLASDYLDKIDIQEAGESLDSKSGNPLFVLILVDDVSLNGVDLSKFHILKPNGKSVSSFSSKKDGFNAAQRELEELLLKHRAECRASGLRSTGLSDRNFDVHINPGTIYVNCDFIQEAKIMSTGNTLNISGNVNNSQIGINLDQCSLIINSNDNYELRDGLLRIENLVRKALECVPVSEQEEIADNFKLAVDAVNLPTPNRRWYSVSAGGLVEATKFVKEVSTEMAPALIAIGKFIWPDFVLSE